jgi:orotate phosphoribosyltransferase
MNSDLQTLFHHLKKTSYRYSETPFQLSSGGTSHHYFNCKTATLHPFYLNLMAKIIVEEVIPSLGPSFDSVGGLTLGADPLTYAISLYSESKGNHLMPLVVRKEPKGHGTKQRIEGDLSQAKICLVVEDVVTSGKSSLSAVDAFQEEGILTPWVVSLLDREEGGEENLLKRNLKLYSLFKKSQFL